MYMASIPRTNPKHTKENVWKLTVWPKNHMRPRITAHTIATPITNTYSGGREFGLKCQISGGSPRERYQAVPNFVFVLRVAR